MTCYCLDLLENFHKQIYNSSYASVLHKNHPDDKVKLQE